MFDPNLIYRLKRLVVRIQSKFKIKKILDNYLPIITLIVTIFSMGLVYLTLNEMQIARDNAYRPDLVFESQQVNLTWGNNLKNVFEPDVEKLNPYSIPVKIYNIGVGTAKNVSVKFDLESLDNLAKKIEIVDQNDTFNYDRAEKRVFLTVDGNKMMDSDDYIWEKQFILPDAQKETVFYLPSCYAILLNRWFTNVQIGIPNTSIHLIVAYEDIQGKSYNEDIYLDCTMKYYENDSSNNGSSSYSIKSRIN